MGERTTKDDPVLSFMIVDDIPLSDPRWDSRANCKGVTIDTFYEGPGGSRLKYKKAEELCAGCEVRDDCLTYVLHTQTQKNDHGYFGGTKPGERRKMRIERGIGPPSRRVERIEKPLDGVG